MELHLLVLRWIHIVAGSLWVGFAVFVTFLLVPAIEDAGPAAAAIMPALGRRGMITILPLLAISTSLTGLALYWRDAGGQLADFLKTPTGLMLGVSGGLALVAFVVGISITRPSMMRAGALLESLPNAPAEERAQRLATASQLRARGARAGRYASVLLLLAATGMAIARSL
jgi:uncharacterized membrane protein